MRLESGWSGRRRRLTHSRERPRVDPGPKRENGYLRSQRSTDVPRSIDRSERSVQAIPSAGNENGRDRPLTLLLLSLPALLRHETPYAPYYFRPRTSAALSGGGPYEGKLKADIPCRRPSKASDSSELERTSLGALPRPIPRRQGVSGPNRVLLEKGRQRLRLSGGLGPKEIAQMSVAENIVAARW